MRIHDFFLWNPWTFFWLLFYNKIGRKNVHNWSEIEDGRKPTILKIFLRILVDILWGSAGDDVVPRNGDLAEDGEGIVGEQVQLRVLQLSVRHKSATRFNEQREIVEPHRRSWTVSNIVKPLKRSWTAMALYTLLYTVQRRRCWIA